VVERLKARPACGIWRLVWWVRVCVWSAAMVLRGSPARRGKTCRAWPRSRSLRRGRVITSRAAAASCGRPYDFTRSVSTAIRLARAFMLAASAGVSAKASNTSANVWAFIATPFMRSSELQPSGLSERSRLYHRVLDQEPCRDASHRKAP